MFYADRVGLAEVHDARRRHFIGSTAQRWQPAPLLERLAREGSTFRDWTLATRQLSDR